MKKETVLKLAVKACNDTVGSDHYAPAVLVFRVVPCMPIYLEYLPAHRECMNAMFFESKQMPEIVANAGLKLL